MNYNKKQILDYIKAIEHLSLFLKELIEQENKLVPAPVTITDKIKETASLKLMCKKGVWPEAIPEEYICGEDYDSRMFRAYGIIEQYLQSVDLTQKKFSVSNNCQSQIKEINEMNKELILTCVGPIRRRLRTFVCKVCKRNLRSD